MELGQNAKSLFVVALVAHVCGHLDLVLHFLVVVHDKDCQNALSLDGLTVRTVTRAINDDLSLDGLDHRLLHEHARLLNASSHVHWDHSYRVLAVHHELLLLVVLALGRVVVSLVGARLSVDDGRLPIHLGVAHRAWHADLLDETAVWVGWHCDLLVTHVLLLGLGLILIHLMASMLLLATLIYGLSKFEHAVGICAVVLVRTGFSSVEVFAYHSFVILKPLIALNANTLASTSLVSTRTTSMIATIAPTATAPSSSALEVVVFFAIHTSTTHATPTALGVHATSTSAATHAIVLLKVVATLRSATVVGRLLVANVWC